ncbi:hypothetical protein [Brevibacillus laterosporus]|nr:hypothetical protein [Brevibacillus laterosporus]MDN9012738.1 hypothetical protein [Brevibacillus laterosporus]MDO0943837.1 hypothetical protein [Brevibacillus laterosporus]
MYESAKQLNRWTATVAIVSVFALTPVWTIEAKTRVETQKTVVDYYTKQANQLKEKLMPIFPKVKDYKKIELENREASGLAYVSMSQNGQATSKLRVEFDKETGKLHGFTFYELSGSDKEGDYQYQKP